ncbi:MAG: tyrosine-type recombinase/integrase, partial [Thermodesulfobacteriota bacterium]
AFPNPLGWLLDRAMYHGPPSRGGLLVCRDTRSGACEPNSVVLPLHHSGTGFEPTSRKIESEGVGSAERGVIRELISLYLKERRQQGWSRSTLRSDRGILHHFASFLEKQHVREPRALSRRHLETWHDHLREVYRIPSGRRKGQALRSTTVYDWLAKSRAFVGFLVKTDRLLVDPRGGFSLPRYNRSRRRFIPTIDEVQRFLDCIPPRGRLGLRDRALFELLYSTGLRAGEASHLDVYDLDLSAGTIRVREGKGGRDRVVPVGSVAARFLRRYLAWSRPCLWTEAAGDALFVTKKGRRMMGYSIDMQCSYWRSRACLPQMTPHSFRHAVATHMLAGGADVRQVQELLGHRWITTTNLYTHLVISDVIEAHRRSHPRG